MEIRWQLLSLKIALSHLPWSLGLLLPLQTTKILLVRIWRFGTVVIFTFDVGLKLNLEEKESEESSSDDSNNGKSPKRAQFKVIYFAIQ